MIGSYSHGTSLVPLLGETIGENLRRTVERFGARDALVVRSQRVRWTYGELYDRVPTRRARPDGPRRPEGRSGRHLGPEPQRMGGAAIRQRAGGRGAGQHQPGLQAYRAGVRASPVVRQPAGARAPVPPVGLRGDDRRGPAEAAGSARDHGLRGLRLAADARGRAQGQRAGAAQAHGALPARRPDQHPVHLGHDRLPQGRDALAPQHPQQRLLHRRADSGCTRERPRLHPGAVLPLLRHGPRQPRLHHARRVHGDPGESRSTRARCWRRCSRSGARRCTACRRCSSPSSSTPTSASTSRPRLAAHRDHGRLTLPDRGDEARCRRSHAHAARSPSATA